MKTTKWIKRTYVDAFPVMYGNVNFPSETKKETAQGPFYQPGMSKYDVYSEKNLKFAEWCRDTLAVNGWTVIVSVEYR